MERRDIRGKNNPAKRIDVRKKISKALKGRKCPWIKKGRKVSWGKEISLAKKGKSPGHTARKGCTNSKQHNLKISKSIKKTIKQKYKGKHWCKDIKHTEEHRIKISATLMKRLGGISYQEYSPKFNSILKEKIRKRDNYKCKECNYPQKKLKYKLNVHHIDYNKQNSKPMNLISLCKSCHSQTNYNRNDWINYFSNKLRGELDN